MNHQAEHSEQLAIFEEHLRHLRGVAYRLLGSLTEAEDILQEARIRWLEVAEVVLYPRAYLTQLVSRLGLDWLKSARVKREQYVGTWLPEPVLDSSRVSLESSAELAEDISMALMLAMERLSPLERAAFLLHDVLDVDYCEIAVTLEREEATVRQLVSRARGRLRSERARYRPTPADAERLLAAFGDALRTGDLAGLHTVLAHDVVAYSDGGGRVAAAIVPIRGAESVARFVLGLVSKWPRYLENAEPCLINGMPGVQLRSGAQLDQLTAFQIQDGQIQALYSIRNPEKLAFSAGLLPN